MHTFAIPRVKSLACTSLWEGSEPTKHLLRAAVESASRLSG